MAATTKALSNDAIAAILGRLEDGLTLPVACAEAGLNYSNVAKRIRADPELTTAYAHARELYSHFRVAEMYEVARNEPDVQRAKLLTDIAKWEVSKVLPKIYGERTALDVTTMNKVDSRTREELEAEFKQLLRSHGLRLLPESQVIDAEPRQLENGDD
jgi:hypothetical protein